MVSIVDSMTQDGRLTDEEIGQLKQWFDDNADVTLKSSMQRLKVWSQRFWPMVASPIRREKNSIGQPKPFFRQNSERLHASIALQTTRPKGKLLGSLEATRERGEAERASTNSAKCLCCWRKP